MCIMLYVGVSFWAVLFSPEIAGFMDSYSGNLYVMLLYIPVITMNSFAKEKQDNTDKILFSSRSSVVRITLAKIFAAFIAYSVLVLVTFILPLVFGVISGIYFAEALLMLFGQLLLGLVICSYGIFISSLSAHPYRAFMVSIAGLFIWWMIDFIVPHINTAGISEILNILSVFTRFNAFRYGFVSIASIIYFISMATTFAVLTIQSIVWWRQKR